MTVKSTLLKLVVNYFFKNLPTPMVILWNYKGSGFLATKIEIRNEHQRSFSCCVRSFVMDFTLILGFVSEPNFVF